MSKCKIQSGGRSRRSHKTCPTPETPKLRNDIFPKISFQKVKAFVKLTFRSRQHFSWIKRTPRFLKWYFYMIETFWRSENIKKDLSVQMFWANCQEQQVLRTTYLQPNGPFMSAVHFHRRANILDGPTSGEPRLTNRDP